MDERPAGRGPWSRRARLRALPTPSDLEIYVEDAPPLLEVIDSLPEPRIAELEALLREVDQLRGTMRRDLSLAATAAEAGADEMASWLLLRESGEVRSFEQRALGHLSGLETRDPVGPATTPADDAGRSGAEALGAAAPVLVPGVRRRAGRMMPAAPLVAAAAAVIGFLTGVVPSTGGAAVTSPKSTNAALESYAHLTELASSGASASRISAAAQQFHAALEPLLLSAASNPAAAEKAIALLQTERALIASDPSSPALQAVLAQAEALVQELRATLPQPLRSLTPVNSAPQTSNRQSSSTGRSNAQPAGGPSPAPSPGPTAGASSGTSSASHSGSSPAPSPKPSPSASASSPQPSPASSPRNNLPGALPG